MQNNHKDGYEKRTAIYINSVIRNATEEDLQQIATVHKKQFPTHFLGRYSKSLLEKFYSCFFT